MPKLRSFSHAVGVLCPPRLKPFALEVRNRLRGMAARAQALYLIPARRRRRAAALPSPEARRRVTLFLAPEAALEPFFASHVLLARVLKDAGHEAILLSCNGMQPTCSAKLASQIKHGAVGGNDQPICVRCRAVARQVGHQYDLADFPLETILTPQMLAEINSITAAGAGAPWDVEYDGIQIGRACLGETLRKQRKLSVSELSSEDVGLIAELLYSSMAVYLSVKALADKFEIARVCYFGDYAYFIAPQLFARRHGIAITNISHAYNRDIDRRFLNLRPGHGFTHMMSQVDDWDTYKDMPIPPALVQQIGEGGLSRLHGFGGASTYSPNWRKESGDLLDALGLPPNGRILAAYSNSTDELLCNREILGVLGTPYYDHTPNPFASQGDWLRALAEWVGERPGLRLIIRLHPRMAKGHRHAAASSEAEQMRRELINLPPNVVIVWPESPMSSYNIAEHAAVALTAWSSIGLELARFGVPVVSAFQRVGPWPNANFNLFSETADGYFGAIEQALSQKPGLDAIMQAYRWTNYLHWAPLIDISDVTPEPDYARVPPFRTPRNVDTILAVMAQNADLLTINMGKLTRNSNTADAEKAALKATLGGVLVYFLTGVPDSSYPGYYIHDSEQATVIGAPKPDDPVFRLEKNEMISLTLGKKLFRRHSPLAVRLARSIAAGWQIT